MKMTEEQKKTITREMDPGRIVKGHKLAVIMRKRKDEILRTKERSTPFFGTQYLIFSTVQSTVQSNDNYIYGVGSYCPCHSRLCIFCI